MKRLSLEKKPGKKTMKKKVEKKKDIGNENNEDDEDESGIEEVLDVEIDEEEDAKKLKAMRDKILSGAVEDKEIQVKASKPLTQLKKGDKIKVDGLVLEVDAQEIIGDYGASKEMALDVFDAKTDRDFQIRYFSDRVEESIEFYELQGGFMYSKKEISKIEW